MRNQILPANSHSDLSITALLRNASDPVLFRMTSQCKLPSIEINGSNCEALM